MRQIVRGDLRPGPCHAPGADGMLRDSHPAARARRTNLSRLLLPRKAVSLQSLQPRSHLRHELSLSLAANSVLRDSRSATGTMRVAGYPRPGIRQQRSTRRRLDVSAVRVGGPRVTTAQTIKKKVSNRVYQQARSYDPDNGHQSQIQSEALQQQ